MIIIILPLIQRVCVYMCEWDDYLACLEVKGKPFSVSQNALT